MSVCEGVCKIERESVCGCVVRCTYHGRRIVARGADGDPQRFCKVVVLTITVIKYAHWSSDHLSDGCEEMV